MSLKQLLPFHHLVEDAAERPNVDLRPVKTFRDQRLGRPVPVHINAVRVGWRAVNPPHALQSAELNNLVLGGGAGVVLHQNSLRIDVAMEEAVLVQVLEPVQHLPQIDTRDALLQAHRRFPDHLPEVRVHDVVEEGDAVAERFEEILHQTEDVGMEGQFLQEHHVRTLEQRLEVLARFAETFGYEVFAGVPVGDFQEVAELSVELFDHLKLRFERLFVHFPILILIGSLKSLSLSDFDLFCLMFD